MAASASRTTVRASLADELRVSVFIPTNAPARGRATLGTAWLTWQALAADSAFAATGYGLLAALMALALLEHWLLVLPLRAETLWGFALRARQDAALAGQAGAATPAKPWSAQAVPLRTP